MNALFNFRALIEYDDKYRVYVARGLETGSVATADTAQETEEIIRELLTDEVSYAIIHSNLANLFRCPAPLDTWLKFNRASQKQLGNMSRHAVTIPSTGDEIHITVTAVVSAHSGGREAIAQPKEKTDGE